MISREHRHHAWRRIEALVCLLTIVAQLALAVVHSGEVSLEAVTTSPCHALAQDDAHTTALSKAPASIRQGSHNPLLCPVCQLVAQARYGMAPHGSTVWLLPTRFVVSPQTTFQQASLHLAVAAPRAPPFLSL